MTPTIRGQYQIQQEIGSGGMGKVYQARDLKLNRTVALKVLLAEQSRDADRRRRFLIEAQSASALNHPNIITIYDIFSEDGRDVMVMEYVPGQSMVDVIPRGGLRVPQVINYGVQIADGLAAAHAGGIIHRDLKPGNIMITDKGRVKILDFGLAKMAELPSSDDPDATSATPLTVEGSVVGTLCYMSPEQAQGKKIDARSDIFSFGAVLYEMATGRRAFTGENSITMLSSVLRDEPQDMLLAAPDIPPELEEVIRRCLRKNPDERWQTMDEIHQRLLELKHVSDSGALYRSRTSVGIPAAVPAPAPTSTSRPAPAAPPQPSRTKWAAVMVAAILAVVAGGVWLLNRPAAGPTEPAANAEQPSNASKPSPIGLTNDSVLEMVRAKQPDSTIISQIRSQPSQFDLSANALNRLSQAGVSATVIEAMRNPSRAGAPAGQPASQPAPPPVKPTVLPDGTPVSLVLTEDVQSGVEPGVRLKFVTAAEVRIDGRVVIPKGAAAIGTVLEKTKKKFLAFGSKPMFEFGAVRAAGGAEVQLKPAPRTIDAGGQKPKGIVAVKGTPYTAYVAGEYTIPTR